MAGSLWSGQPALTFGKRPKLPRRLVLSHNACPQERCVTSSKQLRRRGCEGDSLAVNRILFNLVVTLQVRMYCSSRPKQPGFSFEALFPDELFPPGNKQKGKKYIVLLCFIEQCASGSKCQLIVRTTYYILTCTCMSVC